MPVSIKEAFYAHGKSKPQSVELIKLQNPSTENISFGYFQFNPFIISASEKASLSYYSRSFY